MKFHGVYWPAFLIAAGLEPPKTLLCHAHWTVDHQKMSKSKGNVISPFKAANDYSEDGLRYFILREAVPQNDASKTIFVYLVIIYHFVSYIFFKSLYIQKTLRCRLQFKKDYQCIEFRIGGYIGQFSQSLCW